jgi:hypothetical protein
MPRIVCKDNQQNFATWRNLVWNILESLNYQVCVSAFTPVKNRLCTIIRWLRCIFWSLHCRFLLPLSAQAGNSSSHGHDWKLSVNLFHDGVWRKDYCWPINIWWSSIYWLEEKAKCLKRWMGRSPANMAECSKEMLNKKKFSVYQKKNENPANATHMKHILQILLLSWENILRVTVWKE